MVVWLHHHSLPALQLNYWFAILSPIKTFYQGVQPFAFEPLSCCVDIRLASMPHKTANHQSLKYFFLVENEEPPISKKRGSMHTSIKITGIGENAEKNEEKSSQPMVASSLLRRASFLKSVDVPSASLN